MVCRFLIITSKEEEEGVVVVRIKGAWQGLVEQEPDVISPCAVC